jgi:hypothetical protein
MQNSSDKIAWASRARQVVLRELFDTAGVSDPSSPERKRTLRRWAHIPRAVVDPTSQRCPPLCWACAFGKPLELGPRQISRLVHGDGLPLKVLLTIYRWARPYSPATRSKMPWSAAHLHTRDIVDQVIDRSCLFPEVKEEELWEESWRRNVRNAVKTLTGNNLVLELGRTKKPGIFLPHSMGRSARIPDALWRNGWITLGGSALLLLVRLIVVSRQREDLPSSLSLRTLRAGLPLDDRRLRTALAELTEARVIASGMSRNGEYVVLLDPDLLSMRTNGFRQGPGG